MVVINSADAAGRLLISWDPVTEDEDGGSLEGIGVVYELEAYWGGRWILYKKDIAGTSVETEMLPNGCYQVRAYAVRQDYDVKSKPSNVVEACITDDAPGVGGPPKTPDNVIMKPQL